MDEFPSDIRQYHQNKLQVRRERARLTTLIRDNLDKISTLYDLNGTDEKKNHLEFEINGQAHVAQIVSRELVALFPGMEYDSNNDIHVKGRIWERVPADGARGELYRIRLVIPQYMN